MKRTAGYGFHGARAQRGAAILIMVGIFAIGASAWLVKAVGTAAQNRTALHRTQNAKVLQQAKAALLGWAARNAANSADINPGRLPCPEAAAYTIDADSTNDGVAAGNCTLPAIGRLPWRTLGLDRLRDAHGEPLWYVVSTGWALNVVGTALGIHSNSTGVLSVDGAANAAAALIIAPGSPLNVQASANCAARIQKRDWFSLGTAPDYRDFLECQNATFPAASTFVSTGPADSFNDQVLRVSSDEVLAAVEGPVAARIATSVVPQLESVYASAEWGGSAAAPIFPFAAVFSDTNNSDHANYLAFKGAAGTAQGMLPLNAATCTTGTAGRCDTTFVQWNTATVSAVQTGGNATTFNASCAASTTTQLECAITFSRLPCVLCTVDVDVRMQGDGINVGMTLRTLDAAPASGLTTLTAPLQADGSARATYTGTLLGGAGGICGAIISIACSGSATVRIPISVFPDHPFLDPIGLPTPDAWYWFLANNWHRVTYYAVAPSHLPSGAVHNCQTAADCIAVSATTDRRAVVALAGRSLSGTARPNTTLADYLDTAENQNGNTTFEQNAVGRNFNDRFVTLSNY